MSKLSKTLLTFCGFSIVGLISTIFSIGLLYLFNEWLDWHVQVAYLTAYILSLLLSYCLNAQLVFQEQKTKANFILYVSAYIIGMLLGMGILEILTLAFTETSQTLLSISVIPVTMVINYLLVNKAFGKKVNVYKN